MLRGRELNPVYEIMSLVCHRTLPRKDNYHYTSYKVIFPDDFDGFKRI